MNDEQPIIHVYDPPPGGQGPRKRVVSSGGKPPHIPFVFKLIAAALIWGIAYGMYFWSVRRVVVGPGQVLVLLKKDGSRSLPGDQVIVPRPPSTDDAAAYSEWEKQYADCNGILEQVYPEGTYFNFSPFDFERQVINCDDVNAIVPNGKVGVVVRKFGSVLPPGQVLAGDNQRGPLPVVLEPGRYNDYANPYAYEIKLVDPVQINPGFRGVVTMMAGPRADHPNEYLVSDGQQGTQRNSEPEGLRFINPYVERIQPVSIKSQRFELSIDPETGAVDPIVFPSSDGFDIQIEGFVEWSVAPEQLPLIYVEYSEGGDLMPYLEEKVILPYARSFCRLVGSQYAARDFINGVTKEKFRLQFEQMLRDACAKEGVQIRQAWIRDIIAPDKIRQPIAERGRALQEINTLEQQMQVAKSNADLVTQEEMRNQNDALGQANKNVVTILKQAEQTKEVAVTKASQDLEVAKLRLEASRELAGAVLAHGQADADVILLQKKAEAEPLRQQVAAFGDGDALAQYVFYQKVAPAIKSILTTTDSPLADMLRELSTSSTAKQRPATTADTQPTEGATPSPVSSVEASHVGN